MSKRALLILSTIPVSLVLSGMLALGITSRVRSGVGSDSIGRFLESALDTPGKLTPGHVKTVLRSAAALESAELRRRRSADALLESFASGYLKLALLSIVVISAAAWLGRRSLAPSGDRDSSVTRDRERS